MEQQHLGGKGDDSIIIWRAEKMTVRKDLSWLAGLFLHSGHGRFELGAKRLVLMALLTALAVTMWS